MPAEEATLIRPIYVLFFTRAVEPRRQYKKTRLTNYCKHSDDVALSRCLIDLYQEPITQSIQPPCVRATAFSQDGLFLGLKVFPVKISVSDDVHIKYTNFP